MDASGHVDLDNAVNRPDSPDRQGEVSDTRDDLLEDDHVPDYDVIPQLGPNNLGAAQFAALVNASRARSAGGPTPGHSTHEEAPPTARQPPGSSDEEEIPSPLRTRGGTIRGPPAPPKKM